MTIRRHVCLLLLLALLAAPLVAAAKGRFLVYAAGVGEDENQGVFAWRFDASTGAVTPLGRVAEVPQASFLAIHPSHHYLYVISEVNNYQGKPTGILSAFSIDAASGKLKFLNRVSTVGPGPCFVSVDHAGRDALVANYRGGSVAVFPIRSNGRLGEASAFAKHTGSSINPQRQTQAFAHAIAASPDNRFAIAADLGADKLFVYRFDAADGLLTPNDPPSFAARPGSGPRHFAFHPSGKFAYVVNELTSTVTALAYDAAKGSFSELETISSLPPGFTGINTAAEIQVAPSGDFLYTSNRGDDSIAVFTIDAATGKLTPVEFVSTLGRTPRNFRIDPTGTYLFAANRNTDAIVIFHVDSKTGRLTPAGKTLDVPSPFCVDFVPVE
jgi:6-phosphogluconolactonase